MREIRQSGSEGGARFNPSFLPLSIRCAPRAPISILPRPCPSVTSVVKFPPHPTFTSKLTADFRYFTDEREDSEVQGKNNVTFSFFPRIYG
jgi:hypothetical protein